VVTNGMSQYSRNERNANAGIVVGITPGGLRAPWRSPWPASTCSGTGNRRPSCWAAASTPHRHSASATFIRNRPSTAFGAVLPSYTPGVTLGSLDEALPRYAIDAIREALPAFDKQIRGFAMDDALLTGVETRTSSPLRITRGEDGHSLNTRGLFPAGEGAGYAGGILSAGVDGIKTAEAVARSIVAGT
jgi:uncharacterized FAD-dependent dehydrogenase